MRKVCAPARTRSMIYGSMPSEKLTIFQTAFVMQVNIQIPYILPRCVLKTPPTLAAELSGKTGVSISAPYANENSRILLSTLEEWGVFWIHEILLLISEWLAEDWAIREFIK